MYRYITVVGISAIGVAEASDDARREEFTKLLALRDSYLPNGKVSAGTSRDYHIALECGVDIVRVGEKAVKI